MTSSVRVVSYTYQTPDKRVPPLAILFALSTLSIPFSRRTNAGRAIHSSCATVSHCCSVSCQSVTRLPRQYWQNDVTCAFIHRLATNQRQNSLGLFLSQGREHADLAQTHSSNPPLWVFVPLLR